MLSRDYSLENLPLLQDDALQQEQGVNYLASMPLDVLAMIVKYFSFDDAISFMLTHKRALSLFDDKVRLQDYVREIHTREGSVKAVSYLDVNYLLLRTHFHSQQLKELAASYPVRLEEDAATARKYATGLGLIAGCLITSVISLPAPIVACTAGSSACGGTKVLVGTSVLGPLFGFAAGWRAATGRYEGDIVELNNQQQTTVRKLSASLGVQSIQNKSAVQLHSLFKANQVQREKQQESIDDVVKRNPRRITME